MLRHLTTAAAVLTSVAVVAHDRDHDQATQAAPAAAQQPKSAPTPLAALPADQAAMRAHVLHLASDAMRGREAGTPDYDRAAQYVADQFRAAGLQPGGDGSTYLQRVPLLSYKLDGQGTATWTPRGGRAQPLVFGQDFVPFPVATGATVNVSAPVVFAGWGIEAPQYGHDDFAGADVRGKIVAVFGGAPARFEGEERAFFGTPGTKAIAAAKRGAVGMILLENPAGGGRQPFSAVASRADRPRVTWARPDGTGKVDAPQTPQLGQLSQAGAAKLFGAAWPTITQAAADPNARFRPVAAAGSMSVGIRTAFAPLPSSNVVGLLPGSDPELKREVVVLSAHLDHIGVEPTGTGDRINNGAMDNAVGIASLIEEAKRFRAAGRAPKRSVMFLAVTAEEKGLIGADYFVNNPTVPRETIVADVNLDMPILTYRFEDMIVFGANRSTLGPIVQRAAAGVGVGISPDPMPEQGLFVRSDHFRFVQGGIPSVFLWPGHKGPGKAAYAEFFAKHYHRPSDETNLPIDWSQGVRFVGVNYAIAREIADAPQRPVWNKGDYFGTLYKGPMAR